LRPKPEIQPGSNVSICPACGNLKPPNEAKCSQCATRSCPKCRNILSFDQKICDICNWSDFNFKTKSVKLPRSSTSSPQIAGLKGSVGDITEYKCPQCGLPLKDASAPCSSCGQLVDWHAIQRGSPIGNPIVDTTSQIPVQLPAQPVMHEVKNDFTSYEPPPPIQDYASKGQFLQTSAYSGDISETRTLKHKRGRDWSLWDDTKPKKQLRILVAGVVSALVIIAVIAVAMSRVNTQSNISISSKPSVLESPVASAGTIEISNPQIVDVTNSSVIIKWITNVPSTTQVAYGTTAQYSQTTALNDILVTQHEVRLEALNPGTAYYYKVMSGDAKGKLIVTSMQGTFVTAAPPDMTAPVISNVRVNEVSDISAIISWVTDEKATGEVEYGATSAYGAVTSGSDSMATNHTITINGLQAEKTYYFRVVSADANKNKSVSDGGQSFTTLAPVPTGPEVGKRAPDFTVSTLDGDSVTLSSLRGKIVMINFWSVGCAPCMVEMPDIDAIYKTWSGPVDLVVVAINVGDHEIYIRRAIDENKWGMPIYVDPDRIAIKGYGIYRIPRTFFVDTSGIIRKIELGRFDNKQEIEEALRSIQ
jgi:peroxiredoxin